MRLLFCSAQLPGHLDWGGYLATAVELAQRGHTVLWASGAAVGKRIAAAGLSFQVLEETGWRWPPPPPLPAPTAQDEAWQQRRALRALDQWLDVPRVASAFTELSLVAEAFQPDMVVTEPFVAAAGLVAEQAGGSACGRRLARLRAQVDGAIRTGGPGTQAPCGAYTRVWTARTLLDAGRSAGFALTRPAYYLLEPILVWPAGAPAPDAPLWRQLRHRGPQPIAACRRPINSPGC